MTKKVSLKVTDVVNMAERPNEEAAEPKLPEQTTVLVSNLDAHIKERMKSQPQTLEEIKMKPSMREEGIHLLSIPKELKPYQEEYSFYWLGKDKRKIDRGLDVRGWVIVNRTLFPKAPKHLFSVSGGIERGDALLCCMSKAKAEALRKDPQDKAKQLLDATLNKAKTHPDMYEAKISTNEENDENPKGLVEGRDF